MSAQQIQAQQMAAQQLAAQQLAAQQNLEAQRHAQAMAAQRQAAAIQAGFLAGKGLYIALGVLGLILLVLFWPASEPEVVVVPSPTTTVTTTSGTGTATGTNGNTASQTDGAGAVTGTSGAGGDQFIPPSDDSRSDPTVVGTTTDDVTDTVDTTTPISRGPKIIRLFKDLEFGGSNRPLLPGQKAVLARHSNGEYAFDWKSMKVDENAKIMFSRYTGGGNTHHAYAVGFLDVADVKSWMMSYDAISGPGAAGGTGLSLNRFDTYQTEPLYIHVLSDSDWENAVNETHKDCLRVAGIYRSGGSPYYPDSVCDPYTVEKYREVYTV